MMTQPPNMTDAEIDEICDGLKTSGSKARFLKSLGLLVLRKPNGRPLVARGEFERVLIGRQAEALAPASSTPNRAALLQLFEKKSHGTRPQGQ